MKCLSSTNPLSLILNFLLKKGWLWFYVLYYVLWGKPLIIAIFALGFYDKLSVAMDRSGFQAPSNLEVITQVTTITCFNSFFRPVLSKCRYLNKFLLKIFSSILFLIFLYIFAVDLPRNAKFFSFFLLMLIIKVYKKPIFNF